MRTERCVCGGIIVAPSLEVAAPYVEAHNATVQHVAWRWHQGISRRDARVSDRAAVQAHR